MTMKWRNVSHLLLYCRTQSSLLSSKTMEFRFRKKHRRLHDCRLTPTPVVADVLVAFAHSFPVDAGGIVRIRLGSATSHCAVNAVQHRVQTSASSNAPPSSSAAYFIFQNTVITENKHNQAARKSHDQQSWLNNNTNTIWILHTTTPVSSGVAGPSAARDGGEICRPFVLGFLNWRAV